MNEIEEKSVGSTFYLTAQTFILLTYLHIKSPFKDFKIYFFFRVWSQTTETPPSPNTSTQLKKCCSFSLWKIQQKTPSEPFRLPCVARAFFSIALFCFLWRSRTALFDHSRAQFQCSNPSFTSRDYILNFKIIFNSIFQNVHIYILILFFFQYWDI